MMRLAIVCLVISVTFVPAASASGHALRGAFRNRGADFPLLNVHVQEPPDRVDKQLHADTARNLRRQALELEEDVVFSRDFLANMVASSTAQTQELLSAAEVAMRVAGG